MVLESIMGCQDPAQAQDLIRTLKLCYTTMWTLGEFKTSYQEFRSDLSQHHTQRFQNLSCIRPIAGQSPHCRPNGSESAASLRTGQNRM